MVTKSDKWVSSGYSGFLPHEDHRTQTSVPTSMVNVKCIIACFEIVVK